MCDSAAVMDQALTGNLHLAFSGFQEQFFFAYFVPENDLPTTPAVNVSKYWDITCDLLVASVSSAM